MSGTATLPPDHPARADTGEGIAPVDWALRPWFLAALLGLAGLCVHFAVDTGDILRSDPDWRWRYALAAFAAFGSLTFAFTMDRARLLRPALFALGAGLAMAGLAWRVTAAQDRAADGAFWFASGVLAVLLAIPLFQSGAWNLRRDTPYRVVHFHVWTDAIAAAGALAFTGLAWGLAWILAALFALVEIRFLEELLGYDWFGWLFSGAAFGAALGVLRNQTGLLGTLQSVLMLVLSILAVPLALALLLFLAATLVSGPSVLWNATDSATPVLLACAIGAFVLANAVLRDDDAQMSGSRVLRWAALALALCIAPLAIFAAVSMGVRVAQHGLSPERIWGLIAVAVAVVYGVGYAINVLRGLRAGSWRERVRRANLHMALFVCALAVVLALPLFNFGAVATRDQLARLADGDIAVERFDFDALRWDFGDPGRAALRRLADSDTPKIATAAKAALARESRPYRSIQPAETQDARVQRMANLRVDIADEALARRVRQVIAAREWLCHEPCVALALDGSTDDATGGAAGDRREVALVTPYRVQRLDIDLSDPPPTGQADRSAVEIREAGVGIPDRPVAMTPDSRVELREWRGRRVYVDGQPVGEPFE